MMYSKTSSRGGIGRSVGRSSVPKERTVEKKDVEKQESIQWNDTKQLYAYNLTKVAQFKLNINWSAGSRNSNKKTEMFKCDEGLNSRLVSQEVAKATRQPQ